MTTTATSPAPDAAPPEGRTSPRSLVGIVLGIPAVIALMLLAFAAPALHSGPKDLPLAVSGPPPVVAQLTGAIQQQAPGAFAVTTYASTDEAATAIRHREAIGGLAATPTGLTFWARGGWPIRPTSAA